MTKPKIFNKFTNFINNLSDKTIEIVGIVLLVVYYFVGLLSYITATVHSINRFFTNGSTSAVIIRAFLCLLICAYCLIVVLKYRLKIKWAWLVIFGFLLAMTFISIVISPIEYHYMFVENLYKVVHVLDISPGTSYSIIMFLSSAADFVFGFCLLFILPFVINKPKKLLFLLLPIVLVGILECAYSAIKEKDIYTFLLNNPDDPFGGYGHEAGATFGNKEDWGAFLTVAFASSLASIFFIKKSKLGIALKIALILSCCLFSAFALMSLCKTAILAIGLCVLILLLGFWVYSFKKTKKLGIIVSCFATVFVALIVAMFCTNGFGVEILGKVCTYFVNFIVKRASGSAEARASLWLNYLQNVRGYNLFFGMGKAGVPYYTHSIVQEGQSGIHNGFANFFASYGLIGFIVLLILLFIVLMNILKIRKNNFLYSFLFLGIFAASIVFVLAESEVLIISTSNPVFIFNVLTVILPTGLLIQERKQNYEN